MLYSQGVAPFYDLFGNPDEPPDEAASFVASFAAAGASVLDIGAGTGTMAIALAEAGFRVTALEPDPEMFGALLVRLSRLHGVSASLTPVPRGAGFPLGARYDIANCSSVLHLLDAGGQDALVGYAASAITGSGRVVLEIPVVSQLREPKPWTLVGTRQLGRLRVDHHSAMERVDGDSWQTHWRFVASLDGERVHAIERTFNWAPLSHDRTAALLTACGLELREEFAGYDRAPYVQGQSKVRLVVAATA